MQKNKMLTGKINLTKTQIDAALPKVAVGLDKYLWLQDNLYKRDVAEDAEYQRKYNGFYKVRRNEVWRRLFYNLLQTKKKSAPNFSLIMYIIYSKNRLIVAHKNKRSKEKQLLPRRIDASFASKMTATINPELPVIDSVVLKNIGLKLPSSKEINRLIKIENIYKQIINLYKNFLKTEQGRYLVQSFKEVYPGKKVTEIKMLDFVLWQTRE